MSSKEEERLSDKRLKSQDNDKKALKYMEDRLFSEVKIYRILLWWVTWMNDKERLIASADTKLASSAANIVAIAVKIKYLRGIYSL